HAGLWQAARAPPAAALSAGTVNPTQVSGNGDAFVDPGEDWKFDIVLNNLGGAAAFRIVAPLARNTPGVGVTSGCVPYPNIAAGANASTSAGTPFRFSVTTAARGT